ncbi:hypothetical protein FACS189431_2050 [Alphaproteobacteria bacterium]|nr:hypothetical protein FACS189431_2050 [Alphaproteobacteria bacterium]
MTKPKESSVDERDGSDQIILHAMGITKVLIRADKLSQKLYKENES